MNDTSLLEDLRETPFLRGIFPGYLEQVASISELVEQPAGTLIFREGEPASHVYLVFHGNISLEVCAPSVGCRRIFTVSDGELLGWSPLFEQTRLTASARTLTPARLLKINAGQLLTLCEHNPRFGYEIMRRVGLALAKRLSATRLQLLDVYGQQMPRTTTPAPSDQPQAML